MPPAEKQPAPEATGPPPIVLANAQAAAAANEDSDGSRRPSGEHHRQHHLMHHDEEHYQNEHHDRRRGSAFGNDLLPSIEEVPPPPYNGKDYGHLDISQNGFDTGARVGADGRVNIRINQKNRALSNLLVPALRNQLHLQKEPAAPPVYVPPGLAGRDDLPPPPMNVVIQIVGSRGDVQPFVALGQVLKNKYNHRVRIATHPNFRDFVTENGLEFFSIGGDPSELMAFMVKNPGLMPGIDSLKKGDVGKRRKGIYEMIIGCWRSCIEAGDGTGPRITDDNLYGTSGVAGAVPRESQDSGISVGNDATLRPFVADAIIANPPSFAHMHIAEKLGIPLHLMFTMPWSPTQAFPHPIANIQASNAEASMTNFISYALVDMMTWQGLGDVINRFREKHLGLEPVSIMWAPGMSSRLRIPHTYCWSPALIPKPQDWGDYIDISGFYFLNLSTNYTPQEDLAAFLAAGPPPVYIGFGSIVVDDPNAMTKMIFEAVVKTGQRTLVSKGWGGFGANEIGIPEGVFMLGNVPHDWLFQHVSCVVHHGGAGTTAAGIAAGRPTVVVPFFGDQPFWGAMTAKAGAGPPPQPYKGLTSDKLAAAIKEALKPESLERAAELSRKISQENGQENGAKSFHKHLKLPELRCSLYPERVAVWRVKRTDIRLSALAATVLGNEGLVDFGDLKLYRPREYETDDGPWDPISGGAAALMGTIGNLTMGFADFPVEIVKSLRTASSDAREKDQSAKGESSGPASAGASTENLSPDAASQLHPTPSSDQLTQESTVEESLLHETASAQGHTLTRTRSPGPMSGLSHKHSKAERKASADTSHRHSLHHHGSGSHSPARSATSPQRPYSPGESINQITLDSVIGSGKAMGKIVSAGMKSPMDFTMGLAKGFHNAPKLYGDTVRKSEKITDLQSGFKAAGKEFGYGFYDGITGLVTQPMAGAKKEGFAGFVKGAAKGMGGLILKPGAGIWGIPGYTFKGVYAELQKHFGSSVQNYIIAARTTQGYEEWKSSTPLERANIIANWKSVQVEMRKHGRKYGKEREEDLKQISHSLSMSEDILTGFKHTRHLTFDERKRLAEEMKRVKEEKRKEKKVAHGSRRDSGKDSGKAKPKCKYCSFDHDEDLHRSATAPTHSPSGHEYEEAIQASVNATSRGDPDEDAVIERAIRASVAELEHARTTGDDDAYERAVLASVSEHGRANAELADQKRSLSTEEQETGVTSEKHDEELMMAIKASLAAHQDHRIELRDTEGAHDWTSDSGLGTDDDEDLKRTLAESKRLHTELEKSKSPTDTVGGADTNDEDDAELQKAITESESAHRVQTEELARQQTEEELVMDYIKKQSLLEEEHRQKLAELRKEKTSDSTEATKS